MPRRIAILSLIISLLPIFAQTAPRTYQNEGTATTTSSTVTFTFNPASFCIANDGASIDLWFDPTDGVAVAAANSTNIRVRPSEVQCYPTSSPNSSNTFTVGVITGSSTTAYRVWGIRG